MVSVKVSSPCSPSPGSLRTQSLLLCSLILKAAQGKSCVGLILMWASIIILFSGWYNIYDKYKCTYLQNTLCQAPWEGVINRNPASTLSSRTHLSRVDVYIHHHETKEKMSSATEWDGRWVLRTIKRSLDLLLGSMGKASHSGGWATSPLKVRACLHRAWR